MSDDELQAILRSEIEGADGQANSELSVERRRNMDYYQARPFGNEQSGRSHVVSNDVSDTIEWILPTLIRIFCSQEDSTVEFDPETAQDVQAAKQATDYVNFIWNRDNHGYLNYYSWFKDALMQKNGILKIWWDDTPKEKRERYTGLDDAAFAFLVNDEDVEVSEHTEREDEYEIVVPDGNGNLVPQKTKYTCHDLVLTRKIEGGKVKIVPVPPEEFLISKDARSISDARFVGHRRRRTISWLVEQGYDKETVLRLSGDETSIQTDAEEIARNTVEYVVPAGNPNINEAMRQVWVTEGFIKVDIDGDGIAEMRKVVTAGATYEILANDAWDTERPFVSCTPILMPHRFWGRAVADLIVDIQLIKSTILRQYLDNLYLRTNAREQVIESNIVDPSEVLSSAPGRKIRIRGTGPAIFPIETPDVGAVALEGLNYIDQVMENRTGVSQRTQGLGANQLHDTALGERMLMSAAMGKIELIARTFAETGVKDAFRLILKLICMYQNKPRTIRLRKSQWVEMDPASWNSDMDMVASVGLGMGDRDQQLAHATALGQMQAALIPLGYISPENLSNTAELGINAMGLKGVERFFTFPQGPQGQQPIPMPQGPGMNGQQAQQVEMAKVQGQTQVEHVKAQGQIAVAQAKARGQLAVEVAKHHASVASDQQQNASDARIAAFTAQQKANVQAYQTQQNIMLKEREMLLDHQLARDNADVENSMKMQAVPKNA